MKAVLLASVAAFGLFDVCAFASDLPAKAAVNKAPIAAAAYNWSGFYLGANFGGDWTNSSLNIPGNNFYGGLSEFLGGVQAGYNYQAGHLLLGLEGEFDWAGFNHPTIAAPTLGSVSNSWLSTIGARIGYASDRWLVFGKLGGGWVRSSATLNLPGAPGWSGSNTGGGWLVGGGIEYGLASHWTVKLEYDYLGMSNWASPTAPAVALNRDLQMIKAGINYKLAAGVTAASAEANGHGGSTEELAKAAQNPVAAMISVPFQSNTNFNSGPFNRTQEVFNIQPVVPLQLNHEWNVISRTIVPLISQPDPRLNASSNGIGDITESLFLSPSHPGEVIWGLGPVFTVPSASDPILGAGKVLFGPTAVLLTMPGHWVIGALLNNQWSVGGNALRPNVNAGLAQLFVNYNMADGWYLTSQPIITVNWLAGSGEQWTVPVGGGFGRVFKVDGQAMNAQIAGYYNAIRPTGVSDWQLRTMIVFMFPEK